MPTRYGKHRDSRAVPTRTQRGAARRLKRRGRAATAFQATLLAACLGVGALAGLGAAEGETPAAALHAVAAGTPWPDHGPAHRHSLGPHKHSKLVAKHMLTAFHWSRDHQQFRCLLRLWNRESGWSHRASNPSGAYGIPQALPGRKMSTAGTDWRTNPATQIRWGLRYIKYRYGSPCKAWGHSLATGWY